MEYKSLSEMRRALDHSTLNCKSKKELEVLLEKASLLLANTKSPPDSSYYEEVVTRVISYIRDKEQSRQFTLIVRLTWSTLLISIVSFIVSIDPLTSFFKEAWLGLIY